MVWKTTNALGQEVIWYSPEDLKKIVHIISKSKLRDPAANKYLRTLGKIKDIAIKSIGCGDAARLRALFSEVLHKISEVEHEQRTTTTFN